MSLSIFGTPEGEAGNAKCLSVQRNQVKKLSLIPLQGIECLFKRGEVDEVIGLGGNMSRSCIHIGNPVLCHWDIIQRKMEAKLKLLSHADTKYTRMSCKNNHHRQMNKLE